MLKFRFLGFPVFVEPWFWLTAAFISGAMHVRDVNGLITVLLGMAVVFISIMVHELGHALTIRKFGSESLIYLEALGGLCVSPGRSSSRTQGILISAAGPAAGFALAGIFWLIIQFALPEIARASQPLAAAVVMGWGVNILWSLFNLLPVLPMDGGHIFRDIMGPRRLRLVFIVGGITAIIAALVAFRFGYLFATILLGFMAFQNFRGTPPRGGVETGAR